LICRTKETHARALELASQAHRETQAALGLDESSSSFSGQVWLYPAWRRKLAHSCPVK
jgi:hypothetical protein